MKTAPSRSRSYSGIEPLEARIAPATILVGSLGTGGTTDYSTVAADPKMPVFFHTNGPGSVDTTAVGGDANTYYIKLKSGDQIQQFGNGGFTPLITITKGSVVAFFVDSTTTGVLNQVDPGELSGISMGSGAAFKLNKDLDGSVLSNFDDKLNKIVMTNLVGPKQSIAGIETGGSVTGGIYAGGNIANLSINGSVPQIFTGLAASGVAFDLLRGAGNGGNGTLTITAAAGEAGGSISGVEVRSITSLVAGGGGIGGKGGGVSTIKILEDNNGVLIRAGAGGASVGGKSGGNGGDVSSVFLSGAADVTADFVQILAGDGGGTLAVNAGGKGGAGGKVTNVFVGYDAVGTLPVASAGILANLVEVGAGAGGAAKAGGNGGTLTNVKVLTQTKDLLVNPFSIAPYEVSVHAGNGGAPNDGTGGAGGVGGKLTTVEILNQNTDVSSPAGVLVAGGNGGQTLVPNVNAKGAEGGAVSGVMILGFNADVFAGDGSSGIAGGKGGALTAVKFLTQDIILPNVVNVAAGTGGEGFNGNGGKGGELKTLSIANSNLKSLTVNAFGGGDGGLSTKGKGGDGGLVSALDIIDGDNGTGPAFSGEFLLRSGKGGAGDKGGGNGGEISSVNFFAEDLGVNVTAGAGGNATLDGKGGSGGKVRAVNLTTDGLFNAVQVNGKVTGGVGGNGAGKGGGGAGGDLSVMNLNVDGKVEVFAGNGGDSPAAGGGQGGGLIAVGAFGRDGSGELLAGNAGLGVKAAKGGSVAGSTSQLVALRAATSLTIKAGLGSAGGDGGGISGVAFGSTADSLRPTPSGNILIQAGDGSVGAKTSGKGGSIFNLSGNPSSGPGTSTQFLAGKGAAGPTKGGDGGSVSEVLLSGVGDDLLLDNAVEIVIQAGDAGDAVAGGTGAKGGQIKNLSLSNLDPDTLLRSVAAGNGGAADPLKGKGGDGGTVDGVRVVGGIDPLTGGTLNADIGYRSGKVFGFASMGGLFAGAGGTGAKVGKAGSVRNASADSIAAIVAGRDDAPQAAEVVENISLNGLDELQAGLNSPFTISYTGGGTTGILTLLDPLSVQTAINGLLAPAPDTVIVVRNPSASFQITNTVNGDINQYTAEELLDRDVTELISGQQDLVVKESIPGTLVSPESQKFTPKDNGSYVVTFDGDSSGALPFNATNVVVQNELNNNVPSIALAGGVVVTGDSVNGFVVKFNQNGDRNLLAITADLSEVQRIDTLGVGQFIIDVGGVTTSRLNSNATLLEVQNAINVALAGPTVMVSADPADATAYVVRFDQPGQQVEFLVTEFAPLAAATLIQGTAGNPEVQTLNFVPRSAFSAAQYATANLVGAIVDPNEINSAVFKFTPVGAPHVGFQLGDKPIDGLIVAKVLNQATLNFTPEASLIGGVFFDNDNKI